jgi:hypothetical protein
MLFFVIVATMIAGISPNVGNVTAIFMGGLLLIQGITHGEALSNFLTKVGV